MKVLRYRVERDGQCAHKKKRVCGRSKILKMALGVLTIGTLGASMTQACAQNTVKTYNIAPMHYNRLTVTDDPIAVARGENQDCIIESHPETGDVYILPLTESTFNVFVTTQSGNTQQLKLRPSARDVQNIEIRPSIKAEKVRSAPAPDKRQTRVRQDAVALLHHRVPDGMAVSEHHAPRIVHHDLRLSPQRSYVSREGTWVVYRADNRARKKLSLASWEWLPHTATAVLANDKDLAGRGHTDVAILWTQRGAYRD